MSLLLNPRVLIALALVALLSFTHFTAYRKGKAHVRSEWTLSIAQANAEARTLEQARQRRADEAGRLAAAREDRLRLDAAGSADAVRRLRNELAASRSSEPSTAATERAATVSELLGQCAAAHRELAEKADRHVNDLRLLQEAWPK
jgi:hypothetical protein